MYAGLESIPDGLNEVLDTTDQSDSPAYLRAKKKLDDYLPYEAQLVRL